MEFDASEQSASPVATGTELGGSAGSAEPQGESAEGASAAAAPASSVAAAFAAPADTSWIRVSPQLAWYRRLLALAPALPMAALGGTAAGLLWSWQWAGVLAGAVALAVAVSWLAARSEARSWGYAEGHTDLYLTYGVIVRQLIVVPYGRMQVVDVTSNLLEQALGIATVRVRTAATTVDPRIPGLRFDEAVMLRDRLAKRSETFSTGL